MTIDADVYDLYCSKCKKFAGRYALLGTDHMVGFACAECLQKGDKK